MLNPPKGGINCIGIDELVSSQIPFNYSSSMSCSIDSMSNTGEVDYKSKMSIIMKVFGLGATEFRMGVF